MKDKLSKIERNRQRALAAQENYATSLLKERDDERKRRTGRLIKLGTIVVQFAEAGDTVLLGRLEEAVEAQFSKRSVDRRDFGLDDDASWFDSVREELLTKSGKPKEQKATAASSEQRAASPASTPPPQSGGAKASAAAPGRPATPTASNGASSSSASA